MEDEEALLEVETVRALWFSVDCKDDLVSFWVSSWMGACKTQQQSKHSTKQYLKLITDAGRGGGGTRDM